MAEIKLPIQVNLPDDWMEQIVNKRLFCPCPIKCRGESGKGLKRENKRIGRENMTE